MGEKMEISDFQTYKTIFELALVSYEAEMQGLNPDPRERYIESISGVKAIELEKSKAEIIGNLKRKIPYIFNFPSAGYTVIVNRHFDALEALSEDEKATLTFDELDRRWEEYISSLDDAERAIVENEPQRLESSLRSAIEELSRQAEGKYLEILVEAVKRNIDRQQSRGEEPVLLDHEGRPLVLLADLLDKDRKALRLLEECLLDRPVALEAEQPEEPAADQDNEAVKVGGAADRQQGRKAVSFRHLQECFDNATEEDRKKYFLSGSGRHGKQEEYFRGVLDDIEKDYGGTIEMNTFIRYDVRDFKKDLKKRITDKENG